MFHLKARHCKFLLIFLILQAAAPAWVPRTFAALVDNINHSAERKLSRTCEFSTFNCPFDDLNSAEITQVIQIVRASGKFPANIQFSIVKTQEPKKADWVREKTTNSRIAYAALFNLESNTLTEVVINLKKNAIVNLQNLAAGITPALSKKETDRADVIIRADAGWQTALAKRGVKPEDAMIEVYTPGPPFTPIESESPVGSQRLVRAITYNRKKSRFWYWDVIEGFSVTVDLVSGRVIELWDDEVVPPPPATSEQAASNNPPLTPLFISQPEGSSIKVTGFQVQWYKWKFQYSMDPVQGLQLYHVRYHADCQDRMVLYKLGLSEMFVPYGSPGRNWIWRNAFDAGAYGLGTTALNALKMGVDVPENAILLNCAYANESGRDPVQVPGCIGAFERDIGVLYKHTDADAKSRDTDGRRGRELVLTFTTTVGNYDYAFDYVLMMDGSVKINIRLTGIVLSRGSSLTLNSKSCFTDRRDWCVTLMDRNLIGPAHQHYFNFRLDFDIDGVSNYVEEVNVKSDASNDQFGDIFSAHKRVLPRETYRDHDFSSDRSWLVVNRHSTNEFRTPRGYAVKRNDVAAHYLPANNALGRRSLFIQHPFWASVYKDSEQRAAGDFPRSGPSRQGLPQFIGGKESLLDEDVVVWYTCGVTHIPRPEEWPIMTVHSTGFLLQPYNFLSRNAEMSLKDSCERKGN